MQLKTRGSRNAIDDVAGGNELFVSPYLLEQGSWAVKTGLIRNKRRKAREEAPSLLWWSWS